MNIQRPIGLVLIALLIAGVIACGSSEKSADSGKSQDQIIAGQNDNKAHTMLKLPTVQCGICKKTIEHGLTGINGILSVSVDIENKMGHINYDSSRTDLPKIEALIASLGYQANETAADSVAYNKLPNCCKLPEDRK